MERTLRCGLILSLLGLSTLPAAVPVAAHDSGGRVEQVRAGPYDLLVQVYPDLPRMGQAFEVTVQALPGGPSLRGAVVTLAGRPALETDAVPTRPVDLEPEPHDRASYAGELTLGTRGAWGLEIHVAGVPGSGTTQVPITIAAPGAIPPVWLGYLIGLSPLLGLAWFAWWQRGYLHRLRAEGLPAGQR